MILILQQTGMILLALVCLLLASYTNANDDVMFWPDADYDILFLHSNQFSVMRPVNA